MISKRLGAAAVAAVALLASTAGCGSSDDANSGGAKGDKLNVAVFASLNGVPTFAADEKGLFAEDDFDVTIKTAKTSSEMVPQLLGGKVDLALVDMATSLVAASQGIDIVYVAAATNGGVPAGQEEFSFANLWATKDSKLTSLADLTGKTVGVPQIKSQPWVDIRGSVDAAGGDSSKIKFIEAPDTLAALKSGQVDATITSEPLGTIERAKGELKVLGPVNSGGGNTAYVWIATRAWAEKHADLVAEFTDTIRAANTQVNADADLRVATAASVLGAPAEVLKNAAFPVYAEKPLTAEDLDKSIQYMDKYDMFEKGAPDAKKLVFKP